MKKPLFTALMISLSSVAAATENAGQWYVNPTLGYQLSTGDRNLDDDVVYGIGAEYQYNETWGTELKYLQGSMNADVTGSNNADMKHLILEGMYYLNSSATDKFSPYLAAGLGHATYDYDLTSDQEETTALFGPGFRYKFDDRWSSKVDLRFVHAFDDNLTDGLLTFAVSYALGSTKAKKPFVAAPVIGDDDNDGVNNTKDQCANTPTGVSVDPTGCALDSDGDGVTDNKDQCPDTIKGTKVDGNGCAVKSVHIETIRLDVTFATNSDQLTDNFTAEIEKAAQFMRKFPAVTAAIEGHADNSGNAELNKKLSQRRAEAVVSVLVNEFGIDAQRLSPKGYGEERPTASNDTPSGRQENRRVEAFFEAKVIK